MIKLYGDVVNSFGYKQVPKDQSPLGLFNVK